MRDQPETLAAILAKYRKDIAGGQFFTPTQEYILRLLDRIEAAAEREREAAQSARDTRDAMDYAATAARQAFVGVDLAKDKPTYACVEIAHGNAAALRDALESVLQFDATDEAAEEDGLTDAERIAEYADHIEECQKKARAALAAPARNCDRFNNATEAGLAYRNLVFARAGRVVDIDENTFFAHLANWLFAPAEGGDHA